MNTKRQNKTETCALVRYCTQYIDTTSLYSYEAIYGNADSRLDDRLIYHAISMNKKICQVGCIFTGLTELNTWRGVLLEEPRVIELFEKNSRFY
jgi:hypothetical protein